MEPITLPPTCTVTHAHGAPCSVCKELEGMESQIMEAERNVALLKSKRTHLKSALNALNDPITGKLPFEIVSYIFQLYLEAEVKYGNPGAMFPKPSMTDAPFRLGAVCRRWREIAWASPTLWTSFSISFCSPWSEDMLDLAKQWLGHAGSLPLSIRLYEHNPYYEGSITDEEHVEDMHWRVIDVVNSFSSRWQSLDVEIEGALLGKLLSLHGCNLNPAPSALQNISLREAPEWGEFDIHEFLNNNPGHSPTHLCLACIPLGGSLGNFNWTNLISFEAYFMSIEDCLLVIQAVPRLQNFILGQTLPDSFTPTVITHAGLRKLTFLYTPEESIEDILDSLILPSLETLYSTNESYILDSLISLIGRSSCRLNFLHLEWCSSSKQQLRTRLLQLTPSLNTLILNFDRGDDQNMFVQGLLKMKFENSTHFRNLKSFMTRIPRASNLLSSTLLDIFKYSHAPAKGRSNMDAMESLKVLFVITGDMFYTENGALQGFTALIARGFYISITRGGGDIDPGLLAFHFPPAENLQCCTVCT